MRIAVASEGLGVSPYFERCTDFTCYTVEKGIIVECQNIPSPGASAARAATLLSKLGVDALIAGCIERTAKETIENAGIEVCSGVMGTARAAAEAYLAQTLIGVGDWCAYEDDAAPEPALQA